MPNTGLADFSNVTLVLAIVLYAVAMLAYACDFAFGKRQAAATSSARPQPARVAAGVLVGAGSGTELAGHAFPADPGDPSELADLSGGADLAGSGTGSTATRGTGSGGQAARGQAARGQRHGGRRQRAAGDARRARRPVPRAGAASRRASHVAGCLSPRSRRPGRRCGPKARGCGRRSC